MMEDIGMDTKVEPPPDFFFFSHKDRSPLTFIMTTK